MPNHPVRTLRRALYLHRGNVEMGFQRPGVCETCQGGVTAPTIEYEQRLRDPLGYQRYMSPSTGDRV